MRINTSLSVGAPWKREQERKNKKWCTNKQTNKHTNKQTNKEINREEKETLKAKEEDKNINRKCSHWYVSSIILCKLKNDNNAESFKEMIDANKIEHKEENWLKLDRQKNKVTCTDRQTDRQKEETDIVNSRINTWACNIMFFLLEVFGRKSQGNIP